MAMRVRAVAVLVAVLLAVPGAVGCSGSSIEETPPTGRTVTGSITVSAASSLGGAFDRLTEHFERAHPQTSVTINLGPSSTLATQIEQGAPADVFAAADEPTMQRLVDADNVRGPARVFVRNEMAIVTKPGNPLTVRSVRDLASVRVLALCGAEVPCGRYAGEVLAAAGVDLPEDHLTRQIDATSTIGAVVNGDADGAIVYATDARAAGDRVATVPIPPRFNVVARYPIAVVRASTNPRLARAFVDHVLSPRGQRVLARFGFRTS